MGVLSGAALLNYAYEVMLQAFALTEESERVVKALTLMAHKTGIYGMLGGQSVDVENDGKPLTKEMLDYIYRNKTSALIEASMMTGAILAGAGEQEVEIIGEAAGKIGLAFQIQDDILDVISTEEEGGQSVDVENDGKPLTKEMLDYIYRNKTSALIEASMMTGAILAGAGEQEVEIIGEAAGKIGLAFQIQDDILDVISTEEELGKPVHSDEKNNKVTYVSLFGIQEASGQVKRLSEEAVSLICGLRQKNEFLCTLIQELVSRRK